MKANYFLAGVMALSLLASCVKEDADNGGKGPGEGALEAKATVTIKLYGQGGARPAAANTRAAEGTTAEEGKVSNLSLLVFDAEVDNQTGEIKADGFLVNEYALNQTGKHDVKTTAGMKTFVAVSNNPAAGANGHIAWEVGVTKLSDFQQKIITSAAAVKDANAPEISVADTQNGFLMLSGAVAEEMKPVDPDNATTNKVALTLTRLAAKAQLGWQDVKVSAGFTPNLQGKTLEFAEGTFQLANLMEKMRLEVPANRKDLTKKPGVLLPWDTNYGAADSKNWLLAETAGFTGATAKSGYAPENIMFEDDNRANKLIPQMNEVTCMLIKTQMTLDGVQGQDLYAVVEYNTNVTDDQVYKNLVRYISIHTDLQKAGEAAAKVSNGGVVTYPKGVTYYRVNLADWQKAAGAVDFLDAMSVVRNNFYQVSVHNITNMGWPVVDELVDPDDNRPVEDLRLDLEVTIDIRPWKAIDQNADLG